MALNFMAQFSEGNPQLFRELKGRIKPRNVLITLALSLLSQLLMLLSFAGQLPVPNGKNVVSSRYCTGASQEYASPICLVGSSGGFDLNWQLWWQDVFIWLSLIGIGGLLVIGTYMLISDLSKEEQRGTLNFLRLTPQSSLSILGGKLLGVPILLYLGVALALPLHVFAGRMGHAPLSQIVSFYGVLGASCLCIYSAALLFGLVGNWLGGFQAWLGSGIMLMFLFLTENIFYHSGISHHSTDWLTLFNPAVVLPYLIGSNSLDPVAEYYSGSSFRELQWFYLPIGASVWNLAGFIVLNFGLGAYWVGQALKRSFHNPSATLLSKQQSYWLTACVNVLILGFALNPEVTDWRDQAKGLFENLQVLLVFNLLLVLCLIAALSPHRQALQDWARYRHQQRSQKRRLLLDLTWGEKSPALVAIALNLAIASVTLLPWILLWPVSEYKIPSLWALLLTMSLLLVYATAAQLLLLMKTPKRGPGAAVVVGGLVVLPPIVFSFLALSPMENPGVWLFSAFPWASVEFTSGMAVVVAIIGQALTFGLLSLQLARQLRKAGESSTKALLSGRTALVVK